MKTKLTREKQNKGATHENTKHTNPANRHRRQFPGASSAQAQAQMIGINVLLNQSANNSILQDLGRHGQVLDVIPQINGVTLRARRSELSAIQTLPYVAGANPDAQGGTFPAAQTTGTSTLST